MEEENRSKAGILNYLDAVIDQQGGLKTKVIVELSTISLIKVALTLISAGVTIAFVAHVFKNTIRSKQLQAILNELKRQAK